MITVTMQERMLVPLRRFLTDYGMDVIATRHIYAVSPWDGGPPAATDYLVIMLPESERT